MEKIKFTDIAGMLERDEMRELTGGCGTNACGAPELSGGWAVGGGSLNSGGMGFGGGSAIGSTFGGQPYSGYNNSAMNNFNATTTSNYSSANYSSNNYSSGWSNTANGLTTNDPNAISRYLDFVFANKGIVTNAQTNDFIRNEATVAGQAINNVAYSIQLNEVKIQNTYHGPSTIPQGIVINNGIIQIINNNSGTGSAASNDNSIWFGTPIHSSNSKPTALEAAYMSKAVYGDYVSPLDLKGWAVSKVATGIVYDDPKSGFKSQLYERTTASGIKEYCYVTAGTETSFKDVVADGLQLAGVSNQYLESVNNAIALKKIFGDALSFAGHSMGGGMAEANARVTGESAITFNAAGLSVASTVFLGLGIISDTNAYIMQSDPLNALQQSNPYLTIAGGEKHFLPAASSSGAMNGHSIDSVIESLIKNP